MDFETLATGHWPAQDPRTTTQASGEAWPVLPPALRVLDTNIVLDLWVFDDPASVDLHQQLLSGETRWLVTAAMREELARVLDYPHIARRLQMRERQAAQILAAFDRLSHLQAEAPRAPYVCKDTEDQKFIDLAVQHRAALHSKDAQVLCMKNRLARCGVALNPVLGGRDCA